MNTETSQPEGGKRREANRINSQKSTGPKTENGKRTSAQNATKLGLFSAKALLPGETMEDYQAFHGQVWQHWKPRDAMEEHLLEQYVPLAWRLRRLPEIEAFAFNRYGLSDRGNHCGPGFAMVATVQSDNILGQLARYEATLRRGAFKYLEFLRQLRKEGSQPEGSPPIEAEAVEVESESVPASSPGTSVGGEAIPVESDATRLPAVGRNPDRTSEPVAANSFTTDKTAEVEPELPEDMHHEPTNQSCN